MTLQELRYLVALADTGHFVSAAQACHVGQPTLSMQLKKLENRLGVKLFERNYHRIEPTPVGKEIIEHARVALDVVEHIRELAHQPPDPMDGILRLGAIPTVGPYLVPRMLPALQHSFPKLRLHWREGVTAELLEGLRRHRYDVLLLSLPVQAGEVEVMPLFREPLMLALPAGHALERRSRISRVDLARQPLLLLEEGHCLRQHVLDVWDRSATDEDDDAHHASSVEALRQMVSAGLGCALLPSLAVLPDAPHHGAVRIRPLAPPAPARTLGLVWRQRCPRAASAISLGRFIHANLPPSVEAIPTAGAGKRSRRAGK